MAHKKKDGGCGCLSWILATILYYGIFYILLTQSSTGEMPTTCAVELAGFEGLQAPALSPGAAAAPATSPAFDLVVHVSNGHSLGRLKHGGGDVVVSYAGVPLARGRTPAMELGSKEVAALTVEARSAGVGVPAGDLSRLMAAERRWGVAQLQIQLGFASDSFVCDVQLDLDHAQPRVFDCYTPLTSSS